MNLLSVLKQTNIIKEAEGEVTPEDLIKGEQEKQEWQNLSSQEQAKRIRQRAETNPIHQGKPKEWFDEFEKKTLEIIKKKESSLEAGRRRGGLAKAGTISKKVKNRIPEMLKKIETAKEELGEYYGKSVEEMIKAYPNVTTKERDQIDLAILYKVAARRSDAESISSQLNALKGFDDRKKMLKNSIATIKPDGSWDKAKIADNVEKSMEKTEKEADTTEKKKAELSKASDITRAEKSEVQETFENISNIKDESKITSKQRNIILNNMHIDLVDKYKDISKVTNEDLKKIAKDSIDNWRKDGVLLKKLQKGILPENQKAEAKKILDDIEERGKENFAFLFQFLRRGEEEKKKEKDVDELLRIMRDNLEKQKQEKDAEAQKKIDAGPEETMKGESKLEQERWRLMKELENRDLSADERDELSKKLKEVEDKIEDEEMEESTKTEELIMENTEEVLDFSYFDKISSDKLKVLKEASDYNGVNFEKNYYASMVFKTFLEDVKKYGKSVVNFYEDAWGDWGGAFKYAIDNMDYLREEVEMVSKRRKNSVILFEVDLGGYKPGAGMFYGGAAKTGILGNIWSRIKNSNFFKQRLMPFLSSGFTWAKELAQKGIGFFSNISPNVAIPIALAVAGITSVSALRNRRKRKKMEQLLSKNEKALARVDGENEALNKYLDKAKEIEEKAKKGQTSGDADTESA